jgi:hypothetical protein
MYSKIDIIERAAWLASLSIDELRLLVARNIAKREIARQETEGLSRRFMVELLLRHEFVEAIL